MISVRIKSGRVAAAEHPIAKIKLRRIFYNAPNAFQSGAKCVVIERSRQFSDLGRIVDDRYPARVSSSDRSRKAIVCRVELLNGGFRDAVAST